MLPAPIGLASAARELDWCSNYSTPLLPSADGTHILLMQTETSVGGGCSARFGQGLLGP